MALVTGTAASRVWTSAQCLRANSLGATATGFGAGVVLVTATTFWPSPTVLIALLAGALLATVLGARPLAACCLAMVATLAWCADGLARRAAVIAGDGQLVEGRIEGLPVVGDDFVRFELALHRQFGVVAAPLRRIRVSWYDAPVPQAGDYCRLRVGLREARGFGNPADSDLVAWTLGRGIDAFATVRRDPANACWPAGVASVDGWRDHLRGRVQATGSPHAGVIAALALGDGSGLGPAQWELLRATGTVHLVVISGLHVTALAAVVFVVLGWLVRLSPQLGRAALVRPLAATGAGVAAFGYAALAGFGVATERALAMTVLVCLATACGRVTRSAATIALAAAAVLVVQPLAWREPGALLSFLGVAVLLYCARSRGGETAQALPLRFALVWWRTQWVMLVAALPILLAFFGEAPLASPLGNLLAGALISLLAVPLALVVTLLAGIEAGLLTPALELLGGVLDVVWRLLRWQQAHTGWATLRGVAAPALLLLCCGLLLAPSGSPGRFAAALLLPLALLLEPPQLLGPGDFTVTSFDVGQGTAVLVRTARHALLYDTGPRIGEQFDAGAAILVPNLLALGVRRLDRIVVSHADSDHAGGLDTLRARLDIDTVQAPQATTVRRVASLCRAGDAWRWDGVEFRYLWPTEPLLPRDNDRSCVLLIRGRAAVLLPGDIERRAERGLLATHADGAALPPLVLAHAPHHGSRTSSATAFVGAVAPKLVIHSAASPSRFGHPHPQIVERYAAVGASQFVSGELGALEWRSDRRGLRAWRCAPRYRWQRAPAACAAVWRTTAPTAATPAPAVGDRHH